MIFVLIFILAALGWVFVETMGLIIGGVWAYRSFKAQKQAKEFDLLERMQPIEEEDLEGWDGANILEIDED